MTKYTVRLQKAAYAEVTLDQADIEEGDSPEDAAWELVQSDDWQEDYRDAWIEQIDDFTE